MNIRYIVLIILAILFWRHGYAQYPAAGTKQRLGYQTTGDGLVFRGNGAPAYTPAGLNNAWMYIDTLTRNLYAFTSGTWQLVSGGGSAFDGHVDSLVFNTNVTVIDSTAKMYWDANSETISIGVDGGAVYQLGEELYYPLVINKSGGTIYNGQCVMVDTATLVTGDHVRIILARNGATYPSSYIMGVATTDIPNDSTGLVTWFGYVREVDHADIAQTGVTLVPGNILYPSTTEPGRYTNVAPTTPAHKSTIALVVRKPSDNNMTLLVRPQLSQRLADLSDVNTSSVTGLSVLRYNSVTGIWDASATPGIVAADTASMLLPYLRKVDTISLSNRINLKLNIADTTAMLAPYARCNSTAGRVAYWAGTKDMSGTDSLLWNNTTKDLTLNGRLVLDGNSTTNKTQISVSNIGNWRMTHFPDNTNNEKTFIYQYKTGLIGGSTYIVPSAQSSNANYTPTGNNNFVFGGATNLTTGGTNTIFGYNAGRDLTTGSRNTLVGSNAGRLITTGNNNLIFSNSDYDVVGNVSDAVVIGYTDNNTAQLTEARALLFSGRFDNVYLGYYKYPFIPSAFINSTITLNATSGTQYDNQQGQSLRIASGRGTGNGNPGDIIFATGTPLASGATEQSITNRWWIKGPTGRFGNVTAPDYTFQINATDAIRIPVGNTAQRPTGATGVVRYNSDSTKLEYHNGTAWSGLQSTITNPVTGTGTAGQVSYWSGTGTQTGSNNLFWDNTNARLGIGTTNPARQLDVVGVARIQRGEDDAGVIMQRTGTGTKAFLFGVGASGANNGYFTIADGAADGSTGFTRRFYIDNIGRVGIASTSPAYIFDISSTDALRLPVGTTAQQPTGAAGIVRYNSSNTALEYHNGTAWKTVANTDNTAQTFNFSIMVTSARDTVIANSDAEDFLVIPSNLNGYCIDNYTVRAFSGTGTADAQIEKNGTGSNPQSISGTTAYTKDVNVALATGDVIRGQVFNVSGGSTLKGLSITLEIKATCN